MPICEPIDNSELAARCYNGYEGGTGLKFEVSILANGQSANVSNPYGAAHNDQFLLNDGRFGERLHELLELYEFLVSFFYCCFFFFFLIFYHIDIL